MGSCEFPVGQVQYPAPVSNVSKVMLARIPRARAACQWHCMPHVGQTEPWPVSSDRDNRDRLDSVLANVLPQFALTRQLILKFLLASAGVYLLAWLGSGPASGDSSAPAFLAERQVDSNRRDAVYAAVDTPTHGLVGVAGLEPATSRM